MSRDVSNTIRTEEMILAVRSEAVGKQWDATGFYPVAEGEVLDLISSEGIWIGPRAILEYDPGFRQIIPYIVLRNGGEFVRYQRTEKGREDRLHGRYSLGIGGHVDLQDIAFDASEVRLGATLEQAADRELTEELGAVQVVRREWIGCILDYDTDVGRVHLGFVGLWDLEAVPGKASEEAIGKVALCPIDQIEREAAGLENWSALLLDELVRRSAGGK